VCILSGVVSKDHIHIEYRPSLSIGNLVKRLKCRSSRMLQHKYTELHRRYWCKYLWAVGYGAWSTGNITEEVVEEDLKRHKLSANDKNNFKLDYGLSVTTQTHTW